MLLSYVVGIALGDGNLSNPNGRAVRLRISCDVKYPLLVNKIEQSLKLLLPQNRVSRVNRRRNNCVDLSCYSNQWPELLGWQVGAKLLQQVKIPEWIFSNKKYAKFCLQGLIETDGSVYTDRKYKTVMFVNKSKELAEGVDRIFKDLGFHSKIYKLVKNQTSFLYHVRLSKDVFRFLKLVNPEKR